MLRACKKFCRNWMPAPDTRGSFNQQIAEALVITRARELGIL
jgi:hypothetical protein